MKGQPIETVPDEIKAERTTILAWGPYCDEPVTVAWSAKLKEWQPVWEGARVIEYQSDFGTEYKDTPHLTIWWSLPEPPS